MVKILQHGALSEIGCVDFRGINKTLVPTHHQPPRLKIGIEITLKGARQLPLDFHVVTTTPTYNLISLDQIRNGREERRSTTGVRQRHAEHPR
jgi:hypothetical protein